MAMPPWMMANLSGEQTPVFRFINERFKSYSLPVALVVLTLVCFIFALIGSTAMFWTMNGRLPENLLAVVAVTTLVAATPLILQSMPTIKYLQESSDRLRRTRDELAARVADLDAIGRDLDAARNELEDRVERRTRELEIARYAAEDANEAKSVFLARMSHELRTPLNAIIGFSELLSHPDAFSPERKMKHLEEYATTIHGSGKHLLSLVNDLLDLSKIEAGELELHAERIDLATLLDDVQGLIGPQAKAKGQGLICEAAQGTMVSDRRAAKQILLNLLSNAVKYSPRGTTISLACTTTAQDVVFTIRDQGVGMTREEIGRAMEPFGRLSGVETTSEPGTGLGLPIVVSLASAQGGTFTLSSVPGSGTEAQVTLPRNVAQTMEAVATA